MKKTLALAGPLLLSACGGSISEEPTPTPPISYQFKVATQSMNLCGETSALSNYEVIAYADDGSIVSRHVADSTGQVEADFTQSHLNFAIVRDAGDNKSDKQDLDITVLAQYPVGDLGTLTVRSNDTEGCECQTTTVAIQPGNLTTQKLNLPYSGFSGSTYNSQFKNTQLCEIDKSKEALLVANHLESDEIYYQTMPNPSLQIVDDKISIDMMVTAQLGREITINTSVNASHYLKYVTDNLYDYSVPGAINANMHILDNERVDKIEFHTEMQQDKIGLSTPVRLWGVHIPLTDETVELTYTQPEFEAELLTGLLETPTAPYDLSGDKQRVITGFMSFSRTDGSRDEWLYILPSQSEEGVNFELPSDYLEGLAGGIQYQDLSTHIAWELTEIAEVNSLDQFYQSDWLKVLLPVASHVKVRPPATYSYVALESGD